MALITFKVKVKLMSEEEMELIQSKDMGTMSLRTEKWVVKDRTMREENISNITKYNNTKTLLEFTYGGFIMVQEPFEDVDTRWREIYEYSEEDDYDDPPEREDNLNLTGENNSGGSDD